MKKVIWSSKAREDLQMIYRFYLTKNPIFAIYLYQSIKEEINRLKKYPYIAPIEPLLRNYNKEYRSLTIEKHFKLIYYLDGNHIKIVAVWDCRKNPENLTSPIDLNQLFGKTPYK